MPGIPYNLSIFVQASIKVDPTQYYFFAMNRSYSLQADLASSNYSSKQHPHSFEALLLQTYLPESISLLDKDQLVAKDGNYLG